MQHMVVFMGPRPQAVIECKSRINVSQLGEFELNSYFPLDKWNRMNGWKVACLSASDQTQSHSLLARC